MLLYNFVSIGKMCNMYLCNCILCPRSSDPFYVLSKYIMQGDGQGGIGHCGTKRKREGKLHIKRG